MFDDMNKIIEDFLMNLINLSTNTKEIEKMSEEEKEDILFQIDMQLYNEFNDTIATMNNNLGVIYSLRDVEEVEKAEKEKEIKLLREAIKKQQKETEVLKAIINKEHENNLDKRYVELKFISKDKIRELIENNEEDIDYSVHDIIKDLKELLEE